MRFRIAFDYERCDSEGTVQLVETWYFYAFGVLGRGGQVHVSSIDEIDEACKYHTKDEVDMAFGLIKYLCPDIVNLRIEPVE